MRSNDLVKHGMEFIRAIAAHKYEMSPEGVVFPKQRAIVAGTFTTYVNDRDMQVDANLVPVEALDYILKAAYKNSGGLSGWYIAPFITNITVPSNLTAATATATLGEFTDYDEAARVAWTLPADPTSGAIDNSAAPAVFTASAAVGTGAGVDIVGAFIISTATKSATTGKIGPASKFSAVRNVKATDKLTIEYALAATSTT